MHAEQKGKSFGHDRIAILVSDWRRKDHGTAIQRWGDKYARTPEEKLHFNSICNSLKQKSNDVYNYLQEKARTGFAFKSGWQFK